jgi:hypothetical protein
LSSAALHVLPDDLVGVARLRRERPLEQLERVRGLRPRRREPIRAPVPRGKAETAEYDQACEPQAKHGEVPAVAPPGK